mgnify:CR=1 FL=1
MWIDRLSFCLCGFLSCFGVAPLACISCLGKPVDFRWASLTLGLNTLPVVPFWFSRFSVLLFASLCRSRVRRWVLCA